MRTAKAGKAGRWALDRIRMYSYTGNWETFTYYCGQPLGATATATLEKLVRSCSYYLGRYTSGSPQPPPFPHLGQSPASPLPTPASDCDPSAGER